MRSTIDKAGRVIVPKSIRDALGLKKGSAIDVELRDGAVVIEPPPTPMRLVQRGKTVVAVADQKLPTLTAAQVRAALESVRR